MKQLLTTISSVLFFVSLMAQDTFSIVAVDSATGQVGSAGASCLQAPNPPMGCFIISDVIPGKGAIHTQALWSSYNQLNARDYMTKDSTPAQILDHVNLEDETGDSTIRQYGVALFDAQGRPRTAAYTGVNCYDYKNHIVGSYYTVQGNILLGQYILDSIEARFLRTQGSLADRLMAALQGANVPGADSRCLNEGVPAQSAFIRVAKPADGPDNLYLDELVTRRPYGMSPIDSLQTLFNAWKAMQPSAVNDLPVEEMKICPNPSHDVCGIQFASGTEKLVEVFDLFGRLVYQTKAFNHCQVPVATFPTGTYFIRVNNSVHKLLVR